VASAGLVAAMLAPRAALAEPEDGHAAPPAGSGASDARAGPPDRARTPRLMGFPWSRNDPGGPRPSGSGGWWSGTAWLALVLAVCGGIAAAARRLGPRATAGVVQVVGRVSLSPKHSVYLLRVGRRVLVVGAGPQGPPALITELDDVAQDPPAHHQEAES
jgi:hypothetical protein